MIVKTSLMIQNVQIEVTNISTYAMHLVFPLGFLEFFLAPFGLQVLNSSFPIITAIIFSISYYTGLFWFLYRIKKWDVKTLKLTSIAVIIILIITAIGHSSVMTTPIE